MTEQDKDNFEFYKDLLNDQQRLFDIGRESNFSLWNSLLTFNAIIVTVFSSFLGLSSKNDIVIIKIIIIASVLTSLLLIWNFISTKKFFLKSALEYFSRMEQDKSSSIIEAQVFHKKELIKIEKRHRLIEWFEKIALFILLFQLILILIYIL